MNTDRCSSVFIGGFKIVLEKHEFSAGSPKNKQAFWLECRVRMQGAPTQAMHHEASCPLAFDPFAPSPLWKAPGIPFVIRDGKPGERFSRPAPYFRTRRSGRSGE